MTLEKKKRRPRAKNCESEAVVYRLQPAEPAPPGLDDCVAKTRDDLRRAFSKSDELRLLTKDGTNPPESRESQPSTVASFDWASPHEHEQRMRSDLIETRSWALAGITSSVLAVGLDRASRRGGDLQELKPLVVFMAAARAFRAIRAGVAAVEAGYEVESDSHIRVMLELFLGAQAVLDDPGDEEALRWLKHGQRRKLGKRLDDAVGQEGVHAGLSQTAHGDIRAMRFLAEQETDRMVINWGPNRTDRAPQILTHYALGARDFAVLLEQVGLGPIPELETADRALEDAVEGWARDKPWPEGGLSRAQELK